MAPKTEPFGRIDARLYTEGTYRLEIYNKIVKKILSRLKQKRDVCVVFYGHPGVFVYPAHEAIRLARKAGFKARMLPGVSSEANLCADLGVDPGVAGLQSYEATNFVLNGYRFDTFVVLVGESEGDDLLAALSTMTCSAALPCASFAAIRSAFAALLNSISNGYSVVTIADGNPN